MKHFIPLAWRSDRRVFIARLLLVSLAVVAVIASFAVNAARNEKRSVNPGAASLSVPPAPVGPSISAVKSHSPAGPFHLGDTITYSTTISNTGTDALNVNFSDTPDANTTFVGGSIQASPIAINDSYTATGNVSISVGSGSGVLANDYLGLNPVATITTLPTTSVNGGTVSMGADGSFTYTPAGNFTGTDTFTYTLSNVVGSSIGTVTITVSDRIMFVSATGAGSTCRPGAPCTLATADGVALIGSGKDLVFVESGTYSSAAISLNAAQNLVGQGVSIGQALTDAGITLAANSQTLSFAASTAPVLNNTATVVTLNTNTLIEDLTINPSAGSGVLGNAITTGTTTVRDITIGATSTANGINLTSNSGGTFNFGNIGITGVSGSGFSATGGGTVNVSGANNTIATTTGTALNITSTTIGGSGVTFKSIAANGATNGIVLNGTGANGLIVTGDGASDPGNTTRGNTTAKAGGGTITLGSGGTIQNTTGSGVLLTNASSVALTSMNVLNAGGASVNTGNEGIKATTVNGLTLDNVKVNGSTGNSGLRGTIANLSLQHVDIDGNGTAANTEVNDNWNVRLDNLTGTSSVSNSLFFNSREDVFTITNNGSSNLTLTVTNSEFRDTDLGTSPAVGDATFQMLASGSAVTTLTATGSTFKNARLTGFHYTGNNTSSGTVKVMNSTFGGTAAGGDAAAQNGVDIDIDHQGQGTTLNFEVSGNTARQGFRANDSTSINIFLAGLSTATSQMIGTVKNNVVGIAGTANSGSDLGYGIALDCTGAGTMTASVTGNTVNQVRANSGNVFDAGTSQTAKLNLKVRSNTFNGNPAQVNPQYGLHINAGTGTPGETNQLCVDMGQNSITMPASAIASVDLDSFPGTTTNLVGYTGAANNGTQIQNFFGSNAGTTPPGANTTTSPATLYTAAGGSTQPAVSPCSTFSFPALFRPENPNRREYLAQSDKPFQDKSTDSVPAFLDWGNVGSIFESVTGAAQSAQAPVTSSLLPRATIEGESNSSNGSPSLARSTGGVMNSLAQIAGTVDSLIMPTAYAEKAEGRKQEAGSRSQSPEIGDQRSDVRLNHASNRRLTNAATTSRALTPKAMAAEPNRNGVVNEGSSISTASYAPPPVAPPVSVNVGTLPAGKSVIVKFAVTVNNPLTSPSTATSVSNTGQVSGSNFTSPVNSNTDTAQLCVPPVTTTALSNQTVAQGTTATFTTKLTGSGPFTFVWKKGATTLNSGDLSGRATITTTTVGSDTTSTLQITGTVPTDADTYTADGTDLAACNDAAVHQTATLTVVSPPTISKGFNPTTITQGSTSQLTFTITNPNSATTLTGVAFSDTLPAGLTVADSSSATCSGTLTTTNLTGVISLSGASIGTGGSNTCQFSVTVTGTSGGAKNNTTGAVSSSNGGTGTTSNTATLNVVGPPTISKTFATAGISTATESGTTVTITTSAAHGFVVGQTVTIAGVGVAGYNGTFTISGTPTTTSFTYTTTAGLGNSSGGTATVTAIPLNGTTRLTFTISNPNATAAGDLTGVGFSDTLPSATGTLVVASTPNVSNTCGGTVTATGGSSSVSLSGGSLVHNTQCTVGVDVQGTAAGDAANTTGAISSNEGGTGTTSNTATVKVVAPPSIAKLFNPSPIALNATTSLQFTITNPAANTAALTGVAFSDTLPAGLTIADSSTTQCGGTLTTTAASRVISLSGGTINTNSNCQFSVTVTGASSGQYTNTTGNVSSTNGGTGNTASANLTVAAAPTITKSFNPTSITQGNTSQLTFTLTNPNSNVTLTGLAFTDSLPAGLVVANPPNLTGVCGGTVTNGSNTTLSANDTSIKLASGTLASSGQCTIKVDVKGTTAGVKNNSVQVTSTEGGAGNTSNASLTVIGSPTISKTFPTASITTATESGTTVTITTSSAHGFTVGQMVTVAGVGVLGYNGTFTISGTPTTTSFTYTTTAGLANSSGGTATVSAIPLNGTTRLTFTISNPNTTAAGDLTGVGFSDTLPSATGTLIVAGTPNVSNTCGGTVTATALTSVISLSNVSLAHNSSCTLSVDVQGTAAGDAANTTGAITSTEGGTGATSNTATLKVVAPPSIAKQFNPSQIALNATTSLQFTITNPAPNTVAETGVGFTDTLPAGLTVVNGTSSVCGGTNNLTISGTNTITLSGTTINTNSNCQFNVTVTGTASAQYVNTTGQVTSTNGGTGNTATANLTVGSPPQISTSFNPTSIVLNASSTLSFQITNPNSNVTLNGLAFTDSLPAGLVVANPPNLTGNCGGTVTNGSNGALTANDTSIKLVSGTLASSGQCTITVDVKGTTAGVKNNSVQVSSSNAGTGNTANASITVIGPPTISKSFATANISTATESVTTVTITTSAAHGFTIGQTVTVAGVGVAGYNGTFTISGTPTTTTFTYTTTAGLANSSGGTATVSAIPLNGTTRLTFSITNPNTTAAGDLTGVGFSDTLPSATGTLVVAGTPNVNNTCGGTVTATGNTSVISLANASLVHNSSCTLSVDVQGTSAGDAANTTGAISSNEGGTGTTSNTATLKVVAPPSIAKLFNPSPIALNATTSLQFTITNPAANTVAETGVGFTDNLPAGLTVVNGTSSVCGGTNNLTISGTNTITLSGTTINTNSQCQFSVTVTGAASGQYVNTTGNVSSTNGGTGNTATANLTVAAAPTITKSFNPTSIAVNASSTLSFTISNPNTNVALSGVAFTDSLPAGLVVANPPNLTGICGGTVTNGSNGALAANDTSIKLASGTLASNGQCTITVDVKGATAGVKNNSVQVSSTEGGTGNTSNASLTVVAPPTVSKSFNPTSVALNGNSTLSFTVANPNTASALSGVAFTDNLPAGVVVAATPNVTGSCGSGTITATAGSSAISLSGGTLTASPAAGSTCTFSANVTGTTGGSKSNTTGAITSTEGGTGTTSNTAVLTVIAPPSIAKAFNPATIVPNATTSLQFTITNPAANTVALTGVAFSDTLPTGLTVANSSSSTCGGTLTTTAPTGITLTGATIGVNSQCQFSVTVAGAASGNYTNTTGNVSSTNGGTGNTATANLTVCTVSPVVINSNDSGAGSLRQAILDACPSSTVTFDMTPGHVTSPITLTSGELPIDKSLTIQGPGANLLTISGNNSVRIFNVTAASPGVITFSGLTISNGRVPSGNSGGGILNNSTATVNLINGTLSNNSAGFGGGILNFSTGIVNISNSTLNNNSASPSGGGIFNNDTGTVNVTNSTISGNTASAGGGIFNVQGGPVNVTSSTITGNSATGPSGAGGGIYNNSASPVINLRNTIVALNTAGTGIGPDLVGPMTSRGSNLIGKNSGSTGFINGSNGDIVGTTAAPINPLLGPLANNGGPTQTHALLAGSPAFDAGDNCVTQATHCGDPNLAQLNTDQRGAGFSRLVDGPDADTTATVDIGAFEAQVSVEAITDKTTNEDTQLQFTFNVGGAASITSITATSSNTTLVPNNVANIALTGAGSTRTLTINPAADQFGTSTITITVNGTNSQSMTDTFVLTVISVNDPPVNHVPGPQTIPLNTSWVFSAATGNAIFISDVDAGSDPVQVTLKATDGTLTLNGTTGLTFTTGDGTDDPLMTFTGSIANINAALDGMKNLAFGSGVITITTNDLGHNGIGGPMSDTDTIQVTVVDNLAPQMLTIPGTDRAIAFDSTSFVIDPFNLQGNSNFLADNRTHIMLLALHAQLKPGETASAITAEADVDGTIVPLIVESVMTVPNFDWLTQIVVKFPDGFSTGGGGPHDAKIRIHLRGQNSNQAVIIIVPAPKP